MARISKEQADFRIRRQRSRVGVQSLKQMTVALRERMTLYYLMRDDDRFGKVETASGTGSGRSIDWADRAAVGGAIVCTIHCIGLPVLLALLPALAPMLDAPEAFHIWMLAFTVPIAALALFMSWPFHRQPAPLYLAICGTALLAAGLFVPTETAETTVTLSGALLLATAHIANWRLRHARRA